MSPPLTFHSPLRIYAIAIAFLGALLSLIATSFACIIPSVIARFMPPPRQEQRILPGEAGRPSFPRNQRYRTLNAIQSQRLRRKRHVALSLSITLPPALSTYRRLNIARRSYTYACESSSSSTTPLPTPPICDSPLDMSPTSSSQSLPFPTLGSAFVSKTKSSRFRNFAVSAKLRRAATLASHRSRRVTLSNPQLQIQVPKHSAKWRQVVSTIESNLPTGIYWPKPSSTKDMPPKVPQMDRHAKMDSFSFAFVDRCTIPNYDFPERTPPPRLSTSS